MLDLGTLGFAFSAATGVDAAGQATGEVYNDLGAPHTFLWTSDTGLTDIHPRPTALDPAKTALQF
jgi:hypothetical protein